MLGFGAVELGFPVNGNITNKQKKVIPGRSVTSFVMGTRRLYDFVHNNPMIEFHPTEYTNDPFRIAQNEKMVAINSALEIDLSGQVCADSLGSYFYSGIGGQMDFIRGAALSENGKPIIAMPSTTSKGLSRIVGFLNPGAGVVTTRGHVHWVVTEYGSANLYGLNLRQRAHALIKIAHPDHHERLEREMHERFNGSA